MSPLAAIGHDEAVAFADIEPFDAARNFDQADRALNSSAPLARSIVVRRQSDEGLVELVAQLSGPLSPATPRPQNSNGPPMEPALRHGSRFNAANRHAK